MNADEISKHLLNKRWLHSHEEDSDSEMVFRPSTFPFPPSRGRSGFELGADGSAVAISLGPTDVPEEGGGKWALEGASRLSVHLPEANQVRIFDILSADPDRLVVKK